MTQYVCSSCGRTDVTVSAGRPSLDDRFAVGFCDSCTPEPVYDPVKQRTRPINRATVPLVRADVWDPTILAQRRERKRAEKLIRDLNAGKLREGTADVQEARGLLARYEAEAQQRRQVG